MKQEILYKSFAKEEYYESLVALVDGCNENKLSMLCEILSTLTYNKMDNHSIAAAYIYLAFTKDVINYEQISNAYGAEISSIVKQLNNVEAERHTENNFSLDDIRGMLFAMAKDVRVLIILLSIVQYKMRNIDLVFAHDAIKKLLFIRTVNELYAPLSGRLGLNEIKNTLEDLCFKYLEPTVYEKLLNDESLNKDIRQAIVDDTISRIQTMLEDMKVKATVMGRQKHIASVYKKMKSKEIGLAQIYDLVAVRVIVDDVDQCYTILGKINTSFQILPERFKDYIAMPKPNGYQSLHTCIIGQNNRPVEVQIRTKEMHQFNEYGVAAHWVYKEKKKNSNDIDAKMNWFRRIIEENKDFTEAEFIENIKTDLFASEIFVQTPNGKIIKFPLGAICLDFAYAIHSDVGNKCVGAKINGKLSPLYTKLQNSDICEILTSNAKGPSRDWLKEVKTSGARTKILTYFKKEFVEENISKGKSAVEHLLKTHNIDIGQTFTADKLRPIFNKYSVATLEELYAGIGHGSINAEKVINRLIEKPKETKLPTQVLPKNNGKGILVAEHGDMLTRFAKCCTPIPGDKIIGFVSRGKGVTIHRHDCRNIKYLEQERLISAEWASKNNETYRIRVRILFDNDHLSITHVSGVLDKSDVKLITMDSKLQVNGRHEINIEILVPSNNVLTNLLQKIKSIPGAISVNRMT